MSDTVGQDLKTTKAWICLYTCCATRAIHLDIVPDLTTEAFLRCFKRFVARRGVPRKMVSDNGKTFKSAARLLEDSVVSEVQSHRPGTLTCEMGFQHRARPLVGGDV